MMPRVRRVHPHRLLLPRGMPGRVVIKGAPDEDAVMCTEDKTFALKLVETTNLQLLLPPQEVR